MNDAFLKQIFYLPTSSFGSCFLCSEYSTERNEKKIKKKYLKQTKRQQTTDKYDYSNNNNWNKLLTNIQIQITNCVEWSISMIMTITIVWWYRQQQQQQQWYLIVVNSVANNLDSFVFCFFVLTITIDSQQLKIKTVYHHHIISRTSHD